MNNDSVEHHIKTEISTPTQGDIFKYDKTFLLVTRNMGSMIKFATLKGEQQADIESTLSNLELNYHREEPTATEKLLQSVLGGNKPTGYFGFTIEKRLYAELVQHELNYICTVNLNDLKISEIGGTSAPDAESVDSVINRCLAFKLGEIIPMSISELTE